MQCFVRPSQQTVLMLITKRSPEQLTFDLLRLVTYCEMWFIVACVICKL